MPTTWCAGGLMTKRTKVVTPKVSIGDRTRPTTDGLNGLADVARRLLAAVTPHLTDAFDRASVAITEPIEATSDESLDDAHAPSLHAEALG
jgi:hypothetical protein